MKKTTNPKKPTAKFISQNFSPNEGNTIKNIVKIQFQGKTGFFVSKENQVNYWSELQYICGDWDAKKDRKHIKLIKQKLGY